MHALVYQHCALWIWFLKTNESNSRDGHTFVVIWKQKNYWADVTLKPMNKAIKEDLNINWKGWEASQNQKYFRPGITIICGSF